MTRFHPLTLTIRERLDELADPERARGMAAYLKHVQAFRGIAMGPVREVAHAALRAHPLTEGKEITRVVRELWQGKYREDRYAAVRICQRTLRQHPPEMLELFLWMVEEGAWWDLVDVVAADLVGPLIRAHPALAPQVYELIRHENMWLRRTALLAQLKFKDGTDRERLAEMVLATAHEKEFFIRKAIGWVLREYAKTDAPWVRKFVKQHAGALSPLSCREALKNIGGWKKPSG